eukprot:TRINITY_DN2702_c0_g2_i2.p1 TRINITY_DN2702_c0_g2~~TRINITY_DN2702_c0_g2_i2.p1  ORF type:complete len:854 (-),score=217.97 TRINITY_DN2702_c0_g2_i2:36-2597(-)
MITARILPFVFLATCVDARAACNTWTNCDSCTQSPSWLPGQACRWCPQDNQCHASLSSLDPCSMDELVFEPKKCGAAPTPPPVPVPPVPPTPEKDDLNLPQIVKILLEKIGVTDVDVETCMTDVSGAGVFLKDFADDLKGDKIAEKHLGRAVQDLSQAISSLSNSLAGCKLESLQQQLDTFASSVRWANISTSPLDKAMKVIVGANDLWEGFSQMASAIQSQDPTAIGNGMNSLLDTWSNVVGGCKDGDKSCNLVDGLLKVFAQVADDVEPCKDLKTSLEPAVKSFEDLAKDFKAKSYTKAIQDLASGLDVLSSATKANTCGLGSLAPLLEPLAPKLSDAIVKIDDSNEVKIIVGSADIYPQLEAVVKEIVASEKDARKGDWPDLGIQLGKLAGQLATSSCQTKACEALGGLLSWLQIGFTNFEPCSKQVDASWQSFTFLTRAIEQRKFGEALPALGNVLGSLSVSVKSCDVPEVSQKLEEAAHALQRDGVATFIGKAEAVLVGGVDAFFDLQKTATDFKANNWAALGQDLGVLSDKLAQTGCNSFSCKIVEGIFQQVDISLGNLEGCAKDLKSAEVGFISSAKLFSKGQAADALKVWSDSVNNAADAVSACGVEQEMDFLKQESNVLGLGNVSGLEKGVSILVHGRDYWEDIFGAVQAIASHDYTSAGRKIGQVLKDLNTWTRGRLCATPICYVVNGITQFLQNDLEDLKQCKKDYQDAWQSFKSAFDELHDKRAPLFAFMQNQTKVEDGMHLIGHGLNDLASSIQDCHMADLANLLSMLGAKFGMAPKIQWLGKLIKVMMDGVNVEKELADALESFSEKNWPEFGYSLVKILKEIAPTEISKIRAQELIVV